MIDFIIGFVIFFTIILTIGVLTVAFALSYIEDDNTSPGGRYWDDEENDEDQPGGEV